MKKRILILLSSLSIMFILSLGFGQKTVLAPPHQDNELQRNVVGQTENFHCNPFLLDGQPLDYDTFNINSTGELIMVNGDPKNPNSERVPFSVQLRKNGSYLQIPDLRNYLVQSVFSLEVSKVLADANSGDLLVITPTRQQDWKAKRIIKIKNAGC